MLSQKMRLLVLLVAITTVNGNGIRYQCPQECSCSKENRARFVVDIVCHLSFIEVHSNFSTFQEGIPSNLTIICNHVMPSRMFANMFRNLKDFIAIKFQNCSFSRIPEGTFDGMTALEEIVIDNAANLHIHSDALASLPKLTRFEVTRSGLAEAPNLCDNPQLSEINLARNRIRSLGKIGLNCDKPVYSLKSLTLSYNTINIFDQRIGRMAPNLEELHFSDCVITNLHPEALAQLPNLLWMDLSNNSIHMLSPYLLQNQQKLKVCGLSGNPLDRIPQGFFGFCSQLKLVALASTGMDDSVWNELYTLQQLVELQLSNNRITRFDKDILQRLIGLEYLDLSNNKISSITKNIFKFQSRLVTLKLRNNTLNYLEEGCLEGLVSLNHFDISKNNIMEISNGVFDDMKTLLHLNISYNNLFAFPSMDGLKNLMVLDLNSNDISEIPTRVFESMKLHEIYMKKNKLYVLPRNVFNQQNRLIKLDLSYNEIHKIDTDAFWGTQSLQELNLEYNDLDEVTGTLNIDSLKVLNLRDNSLTGSIHDGMIPESIETVDLSYNNLNSINSYAFYKLKNIQKVDVRFNQISTLNSLSIEVSPTTRSHHPSLLLSGNPMVCDCRLKWLREMATSSRPGLGNPAFIQDLNNVSCVSGYHAYSKSLFQLDPKYMLCEYERECVRSTCKCCDYFRDCVCHWTCPDHCTCYRSTDHISVNYINCSRQNITTVPYHTPSIATHIWLDGNFMDTLGKHSFLGVDSAEVLFLNNSHIQSIDNGSFVGLHSLVTLYLNHNLMSELSYGMLYGLSSLKELYLHNNKIEFIDEDFFDHTPNLRYLNLANNQLRRIPDSVYLGGGHGMVLGLAGNPWSCACDYWRNMVNKINFLAENVTDRRSVRCYYSLNTTDTESSVSNTRVNNSSNICPDLELLISADAPVHVRKPMIRQRDDLTLLICVTSGIIFIALALGVAFWYKTLFELLLFSKFGVRMNTIYEDENKIYDAFISSSKKDESFVDYQLVPKLEESKLKYKVNFIRESVNEEDFQEQFASGVTKSRRVIVVVSKNFMEDEWQQLEFRNAHICAVMNKRVRFIFILFDDISAAKLPLEMGHILKRGTCIRYKDSWFWDKLFYAMPAGSLHKRQVSPDVVTFTNSAHRDDDGYETPVSRMSMERSPSDVSADLKALQQMHVYEEVHPVSTTRYKMYDSSNTHTFPYHSHTPPQYRHYHHAFPHQGYYNPHQVQQTHCHHHHTMSERLGDFEPRKDYKTAYVWY